MSDQQQGPQPTGGDLELANPPAALRALGWSLRQHSERVEVAFAGGVVVKEETVGPLTVSLRGEATLRFSGGSQCLGIVWDALDGVTEAGLGCCRRCCDLPDVAIYVQRLKSGSIFDVSRLPASIEQRLAAGFPE